MLTKENKKFIVYEHVFPNGKRYIGITCKTPRARWGKNGKGYYKKGINNSPMYNAILKYGWDNVEHNILYTDLTEDEAKEKEIELIEKYHTWIRDPLCSGYNSTKGGEGVTGRIISEEQKEKLRERLLGKRGKDCVNSIPVLCDGKKYDSLTDFIEAYNLQSDNVNSHTTSKISAWLKGKKGMPKKFWDMGLRYYDDELYNKYKDKMHQHKRTVKREVEIDGITFKSQKEISDYINVNPATITNWLNGKHKIPEDILARGFRCKGLSCELNKTYKTHKVYYDGKIYNSQRELARFLGIKNGTLWTYLNGEVKMPKYLEEKGLRKL